MNLRNNAVRWLLPVLAICLLIMGAGDLMAQTNTINGIYSSVTTGFTSVFDALIALAVGILVVSVGFALVRSMVPHRAKIK